jgi:lipid-A-disaccharide synthase
MNPPLNIMIVAGEASGDQHAADLVKAIKEQAPQTAFFGFGGSLMAKAGVDIRYDLVSMAVIGVAEALKKIATFFRILKLARQLLSREKPDVVVLTDFPDLNFKIAARAKALGIPVVYYISPQIWAWRKGRIHTLKKIVDHMIVILPFEESLYKKAGIPVTFVGHPLVDAVKPEVDPALKRTQLLQGRAGPLVALAPGSRSQEIELLLPIMARCAKALEYSFSEIKFFIPLARTVSKVRVQEILDQEGLQAVIVEEAPLAARAAADLTIISSGTATLETAILNSPMLIAYRMHPLSYGLARLFVRLPYFGLANLTAGEKVAPEFLQHQFTPEEVVPQAVALLSRPELAEAQRRGWARVRARLGEPGAAKRAAEVVLATAKAGDVTSEDK